MSQLSSPPEKGRDSVKPNNAVWIEEYLAPTDREAPDSTSRFFMHLWEPTAKVTEFTAMEIAKMSRYDSLDYAEPNSFVFREHLATTKGEGKYLRLFVFGIIGVVVGLWGFVLFTSIETIFEWRSHILSQWIQDPLHSVGWVALLSFSSALASASICVMVPAAAGSGVPEVMAYLNGVMFPRVFNIRTLAAKSLSTILSVCSGLPVGAEGPMIHIGSLIAAGISSGRSRSLHWKGTSLSRFRNTKDARDFVTAGAAAGITFVFRAPIGGLLFIMEEVASFFPTQLAWFVFFCCLCTAMTEYILYTYFHTWTEIQPQTGNFAGDIPLSAMVLFGVVTNVPVNIFALVPAAVVGVLGGLLAVLFIMLNMTIVKLRGKYITQATWRRVLEPCVIATVYSTLSFVIASQWSCHTVPPFAHPPQNSSLPIELFIGNCVAATNSTHQHHNSYASLALMNGMTTIRNTFNAPANTFDILSLLTFLIMYFTWGAMSQGMFISCGVLVPTCMIGAILGRLCGTLLYETFDQKIWSWGSPAMFSVLGTAAFFSGTTRLTFSLAVIIIEMTDDLEHLILVMVVIWVAKAVADQYTASFVHAALRAKSVPFLDTDLSLQKLDMYSLREIMTSPVLYLRCIERIDEVVRVLESSQHHGFPVVNAAGQFRGVVTRDQLEVLLWFIIMTSQRNEEDIAVNVQAPPTYAELVEVREKIFWTRSLSATGYPLLRHFFTQSLDLQPYIDTSAVAVQETMSISRTYVMFRSLNLRHLTVTDCKNEPIGIITRKDLVHHGMVARLARRMPKVSRWRPTGEGTNSSVAGGSPKETPTQLRSPKISRAASVFSKTLVVTNSPPLT